MQLSSDVNESLVTTHCCSCRRIDDLKHRGRMLPWLVLASDGFLSFPTKPRKDDCPNPADYFSGHKRVYGINFQAVDLLLGFRRVCLILCTGALNTNGNNFVRVWAPLTLCLK
jgi:hypothetical protein